MSLSTVISHWLILLFEAWLAAILISCGSRTAVFANSRTLRDSVAEKSRNCTSLGRQSMILLIDSIKPISSMRSASSSTTISISSK
ncbi:Uncharacterised protein [Vibrio cholerae]|uniref:Uncharacterized protein n=1 Tax=Vibrio cholerae TaxID=666 RepID=A0A655PMX1_VIBCL|nr:Uncharacterised protein [Vibrio cholerae]